MFEGILKFGLFGLGLSGVLIGLSLSIFGSDAVANFFVSMLLLKETHGPITDLGTANIESELRFFGMMFAFYGGMILWVLRNFIARTGFIPVLLGVFFLSGLARLWGYAQVGPPHMLFIILMTVELGLPLILGLCYWLIKRR